MSLFFLMRIVYLFTWIYIAWRVNAGFKIKRPYSAYIYCAFSLLMIFSILTFTLLRNGIALPYPVSLAGDILMGCCGIIVTFFVLNDIINIINLLFKIKNFRYYSTLITVILSVLGCAWALFNAAFILNVKEVKIKVPELPVDSLKIVQLSDIHINKYTSREVVRKIFEKAAALNPDLIVITGDVIDYDINEGGKFRDYGFELLKAPYGVFAVTGNHERRRLNAYFEMFEKLGIKVLKNENVFIHDTINIAGINDNDWRGADTIKTTLGQTVTGYPALFLSHRPETFGAAADSGINIIQLSGHTHAGQIPPIEIARRFFMQYNYGIYRKKDSVMYVSSGTRWWGPPMRFGNFGEIALISLEKNNN